MSQEIQGFVEFLTQTEKDYAWHKDQVTYADNRTSDLLHTLELESTTKNERNKIATELVQIRRARREHKNIVECTQPVMEFLESDKGRQIYNLLREVQGKTKKIESYHANRQYWMRAPVEGKPQTIKHKASA